MKIRTMMAVLVIAALIAVIWFVQPKARYKCTPGGVCKVAVYVVSTSETACEIKFRNPDQLELEMPPGNQPGGRPVQIRWDLDGTDAVTAKYVFRDDSFWLKSTDNGQLEDRKAVANGKSYQLKNKNDDRGTHRYGLKVYATELHFRPSVCQIDPYIYNID